VDFPIFLFANVGDDSEHPATLRYLHEIAMPFAKANGIQLEEIRRLTRDGRAETLLENISSPSRTVGIPVRMGDSGAPGTRRCTGTFKLAPVKKRLRELGATKEDPAVLAIGISLDEIERAGNVPDDNYSRRVYPLLDLGLRRSDCMAVIQEAGLPIPQKSACYFCPFHRPSVWREQRRDEPDLFEKSADLETLLNERRDMLGKDHVYLTRFGKPLREAISEAQATLFDDDDGPDTCGYGSCFT
jgi:hypothetical protein